MPFIFLLLFALICLQSASWPAPPSWLTPESCGMLMATMVLASWLLAGLIARAFAWQIGRQPEQRHALLRRYTRWRRHHFMGLLGIYLFTLYVLGWGHVLTNAWTDWQQEVLEDRSGILPGLQIGLLAPFFAGLFLSWERFYLVERTAYEQAHFPDPFISRGTYVLLQIRHQLLIVLPPILLLLFQQVLFSLVKFEEPLGEEAALIATLVIVTAFLLSMPLLLRLFLGLKPLPLGPLRERLDGAARRLHFRYSNVLVWNTRHLFANAMVTGFIPWLRYIILTDRLVEELTPDEVEAVFGHEIGHIKHHHLLFYLTFFLASFLLLGLFWETIKEALPIEIRDTLRAMSGFGKLGLLAGYTLLVFGYLSRRCERQADLFGSNTVSTDVFISALEKVAAINGIPRDRPGNWLLSWQHPTIAQRIDFLERMRDHPAQIQRFHLSIRIMQLASLCLLAFLVWWFHDSFLPILMEL